MKNTFKVLMCSLLGITLVACSSNQTSGTSTTTTVAPTSATTEDTNTENSTEGILIDYSGEIVTLNSIDGNQYLFKVTDTTTFESNCHLYVGDDVTLYYTGSIEGTDTENATVTRVVDHNSHDISEEEQTIAGKVLDASMNTITISDVNQNSLTFETTTAEYVTESGIQVGDVVYIDYRGTINGTDTSSCAVIRVTDNDTNETPNATPITPSTPIPTTTASPESSIAPEATATPTPTPTLTPPDQIQYVSSPDWMYVVGDADMYAGNSKEYRKVGHVYAGQGINTVGYTNDGWILCNQEGTEGWVQASDLTKPTTASTPTPTPTATPVPTPTATPDTAHVLYIHYIDEQGNKLFTDYVKILNTGTSYSITSPTLDGYECQNPTVEGTMGNTDANVTVCYVKTNVLVTSNTAPNN